MSTHSSLRPMDAFDPAEPAILHDLVSDLIITWTAYEADDYRRDQPTARGWDLSLEGLSLRRLGKVTCSAADPGLGSVWAVFGQCPVAAGRGGAKRLRALNILPCAGRDVAMHQGVSQCSKRRLDVLRPFFQEHRQ